MLKINKVLITSVLILTQWALMAQNSTNSPYTRFGYGELGERSFGAGRAMGGVGFGLRSPKQINPMNPASYSSIDSMTFLFDFGVGGQLSWFDDGNNRQHDINGNVEYIAMQFPVTRRIAMSFGLLPYSFVGYKFGTARSENGVEFTETYNGTGGMSEAYGGIAIDLWPKRLSFGANFGYLFGTIKHEQIVLMTNEGSGAYNTNRNQQLKVRDFVMDFGLQYTQQFSKDTRATLGVVYSPQRKLNAENYKRMETFIVASSGEVLSSDTIKGKAYDLASKYGVGVSFVKDNKFTVAADFSYEDWGKMKYFGEEGHFQNRYRVALGGEFIPEYNQKSYFKRIRYRGGVHYGNSYMRFNQTEANPGGHGYDEVGASIGLGLPLIDNRSLVNISLEYMKKVPTVKTGMIDEQYFKFTLNYTFNELWFFKRKLD